MFPVIMSASEIKRGKGVVIAPSEMSLKKGGVA